jgi:hypothetical protein
MHPKTAEKLQNKIYQRMSPKRKVEIVSELILLAKKLSESKIILKKKKRKRKEKKMTPKQLLCKIAKILQDLKIPYAITGGFAVAVWGKPRFTADIDIIVKLVSKNIFPLNKALLAIDKNVYVSEDAMKKALERKGEFNLIHPQTGLKVDFWISGSKADIYGKLKLKRAVVKKIDKQEISFISPEDLILSKLSWYKESGSSRHLEDAKTILDNPILKLDLSYIKKWAKKQSTIKILEKILRK